MEYTEASTSAFVDVQADGMDLRVHYNDIGSGDEVIVMLHGSGPGASGWANFNKNIEPFTSQGYRVIFLDSPGWGKSDPVISKTSRSHLNAAALKGLLDGLKIERAHLVGNSMGAHSAVAFTLDNPGRVDKLVLMGGGTGGASPFVPMPTEGLKLIAALYRDPTIENLKRMMNVFVYDPSSLTDALFKARLDNILASKEHCENFVKSAEINPRQYPDVTARLHEISAKTLIVWGRDDRFVPMDVALRLLASIKHSQLHVFSQCGHWAQWEHADTFNRLLLDFLKH